MNTIFSKIKFKDIATIIEKLQNMRDNLIIAGNTQPPIDEEYWKDAEKDWLEICYILIY